MARIPLLVCFIISAVSATSPESPNKTDGSTVPVAKPNIPRRCPANEVLKSKVPCPPDTCDMLYLSVLCIADQTESVVCTCKDGYRRTNSTASGVCVPEDRCLPPECANDPNAKRGCGNRCRKTCADYNDTTKVCNDEVCNLYGCECKDGFVYDENIQKCVKPKQCTKQCKGPHEKYIDCPAGQCNPKTCDDLVNPPGCPRIKPPCPGGCVCKDGYLRNSKGVCIKKEQCPSLQCKKPHERYSNCLLGECRPKTCGEVGYPVACPDIVGPCAGGCTCDEGFVRDCNGDCIDMKNCPCCGGDPNAVSGCGNPCGKTCASLYANKSDLICPQYCEYNGCDCKPGFLLLESNNTDSNKCVPERKCPKPPQQCDVNEQYYCGSSCPEATCANPTPPTCVNKKCKLACFCKKGYVRDANNKCVPVEKCPKQCKGPHEKYIDCPAGQCNPKTCDDLVNPPGCPRIKPPCPGGCVCKDGYLRNSKGVCIKKEQCPSLQCKKPHERYSNCLLGECRPKTCGEVGYPVACPDIVGPCAGGCTCDEGFVRDCNGDCIDMKNCPCCGGDPNAVSGCGNPCGKTCASLYANKSDLICPQYCEYNGCDCKPGFLLLESNNTDSNKCVPERKCPKPPQQCDVNEQYYCGSSCPEATCANPTPPTCVNKKCKLACFCKKGYVRDANNKCVPVEKCPKQCKGPHEKYIDCPAGQCNPKTCDDLVNPPGCPRIKPPCPGGCVCKDGYLINSKGVCIKKEQCPSLQCKKPHERYSNCLLGECRPKTCGEVGYPVACPDIVGPCAGGCTCDEGFVRDCNGDCIDMKNCPCCGGDPNAVSGCGNPCGKTCASLYANKSDLICPQYCEYNGCDCKPGFLLLESNNTDSNKCVPERKCPKPPQQCDVNEQYYCGSSCPEATCANPTPPTCVNKKCKLACFCKKGYVRDANNKCVPVEKCPAKCKGLHEEYIDCPAGQCNAKTCKDLITPPPCPGIIPPCPGGCVCKEGYLRDSKGICIKKEQCQTRSCPENEVLKSRVACPPDSCDTLYLSFLCVANQTESLMCTCKDGYRRTNSTATGVCVPEDKCLPPECADDPNAKRGCGNRCGKTCADYKDTNKVCNNKLVCKLFGCDCQDGFVYDENIKKCVKPDQCTEQCKGPHEKYIDCPAGQCNAKTCKDLITPPPCPRIIPPCPGGCVCEEGYLRDSKGICIKKEQCPQFSCSANQTYVTCNVKCPDKFCPKDDEPQPVCDPPRDCPPGCTCKINYRYDQSGECILASECPPINCTGQNTVWDSCPSDCLSEQCEDADSPPVVCNTLLLNCQPRCVCKKGHFRNKDGLCVPAKECPFVCKDPNASWKDCKDACPGTCENTRPGCVNKMCTAGCQCNDGYVLSKSGGKCVKIEECPDYAECGANQTFVQCTFRCPQVMCPESDQTILCKPPRDCPGGCGCKPYYRYNATGDCVKASDCPPVECTRPNEEWTSCQRISDWERCDDRYNSPPFNPGDPDDCTPKCVCKKGFWRNDANDCVPEKECPPING